ncbi:MAG: hypothetical protein AAFU77_13725 [Myxococcota bacterium]
MSNKYPDPGALRQRLVALFERARSGSDFDGHAPDELALAMVRVNFPLRDIVALYDQAAVDGSTASMIGVRDSILGAYTRVIADYRNGREALQQEIVDRRVTEDRLRESNGQLLAELAHRRNR